jgi:hypothetical protein
MLIVKKQGMPLGKDWTENVIENSYGYRAERQIAPCLGPGNRRAVFAENIAGGGEESIEGGESLSQ